MASGIARSRRVPRRAAMHSIVLCSVGHRAAPRCVVWHRPLLRGAWPRRVRFGCESHRPVQRSALRCLARVAFGSASPRARLGGESSGRAGYRLAASGIGTKNEGRGRPLGAVPFLHAFSATFLPDRPYEGHRASPGARQAGADPGHELRRRADGAEALGVLGAQHHLDAQGSVG